ncbi:hypothetical protein Zm00014a_001550 [Zea mays]|uniref:Arginine/serine-rich coiled-coil protein 2 n=1 Tax=Zea mays TaxID=4577 RepID=A0A3L6F1J1_MAIZE|nr:hypothetical protein Zm00014a_001550 [Zea mays]PWZ27143.1 hypothetical protein Zm00014a_001550 [Zea mays]PWZ27144.1 hypothetical protein Zm00014a_001550 [Zea mays]
MNSKSRRSHSPVEYKEGREKDYETSGRKDKSRDLDDTFDAKRGHESGRHSDRHSYGTSRESRRHDDYRRYHDKSGDDYGRSYPRASWSDRESRADTYYDRSKHDSTSGRSRGDQQDVGSRYGEKSVNRDQRSINEEKQEPPRGYQKSDVGGYNKCTDARKQEYRGYGDDRDHYRVVHKNKETIKEEVLKRRNGKEVEKEALVETREKKRSLFSSTGPNVDNPGDAKPSATTEALDNSAGTIDGVNAAKVAAMKAAELVNRNIAAFGAGTGRLSTDQKKKLLWGNKKNNPSEEVGCEEQCPGSGKHGREQGRELSGRSQETGGARHQPGEALHSRPPQERWQDSRPWPLETLLADDAALKSSDSLLCTIYSIVFILALTNFPGWFMLTVLPGYLEAVKHLCLIDSCIALA